MRGSYWIPIVLYAIIVVTIFSFTTSWLYEKPLMYDSAVFQLIGKNWAEGRIPYKDLWELKGPMAFLPSALGYWLLGTRMGVYIIQVICLTITFFFILQSFLHEFNRKTSILLTGLVASYFCVLYESGNTVEEYLLPLLSCAFYYLLLYINRCIEAKEYDLPCGHAFAFGCVLGFSFMSRLTNAISICIAVLVIGIILIAYRRWLNLLRSSFYFICGFLVLTVPFLAYFYLKNALDEMWYGTFLFGLEYAGNSGFDIFSLFGLRHVLLRLTNCYLLVLTAVFILRYNPLRKLAGVMWLSVSMVTMLAFLRLNAFGHYYIVTLPFIPIVLVELHKLWNTKRNNWNLRLFQLVIMLYILLGVTGIANNLKNYFLIFRDYKELVVYEKIIKKLPSDFWLSFIAYDCDPELYLYFDIPPQYPFYAGQSFLIENGSSIVNKIYRCFRDGDAKYMVVYGEPELLQDIIGKKYNLIFSERSTRGGLYRIYSMK